MVRLKDAEYGLHEQHNVFQFHYGTIKSTWEDGETMDVY